MEKVKKELAYLLYQLLDEEDSLSEEYVRTKLADIMELL